MIDVGMSEVDNGVIEFITSIAHWVEARRVVLY